MTPSGIVIGADTMSRTRSGNSSQKTAGPIYLDGHRTEEAHGGLIIDRHCQASWLRDNRAPSQDGNSNSFVKAAFGLFGKARKTMAKLSLLLLSLIVFAVSAGKYFEGFPTSPHHRAMSGRDW